ncbi:MAG: hypothetical protein K2P80_08930 [Beijerinckiaceae bacterium]|nr:hypothetical protein [Beijerinckiaceae bacterium]
MITRLALAAAFAVAATAASAQTAPAPTNPLQQRRTVAPPAAAPAAPAATTAPAAAPKAAVKGAGAARRTQCSKEYQAAKAANTLNGQKWSQFYSACNTRLKAAGQ